MMKMRFMPRRMSIHLRMRIFSGWSQRGVTSRLALEGSDMAKASGRRYGRTPYRAAHYPKDNTSIHPGMISPATSRVSVVSPGW
jgi:hypothetical protein